MQAQTTEESLESRTLWMGAVQPGWDETYLYNLFAHFGTVVGIKLMRTNAVLTGYAFIEFRSSESAQQVLDSVSGVPIPGTPFTFRLNWSSRTKPSRGTTQSGDVSSLFVGDLGNEITDHLLLEAFQVNYPSCYEAKVIADMVTGHSKGYGFVRFSNKEDCNQARESMNNVIIGSRAVRVGFATERKSELSTSASDFFTTVFIGQLDEEVGFETIYKLFSPFGNIENVKIPPRKSCGFVRFSTHEQARNAIAALQGKLIGRTHVRLYWGKQSFPSSVSLAPVPVFPFVQPNHGVMFYQPHMAYVGQYYNYPQPYPHFMQPPQPTYAHGVDENRRVNGENIRNPTAADKPAACEPLHETKTTRRL